VVEVSVKTWLPYHPGNIEPRSRQLIAVN